MTLRNLMWEVVDLTKEYPKIDWQWHLAPIISNLSKLNKPLTFAEREKIMYLINSKVHELQYKCEDIKEFNISLNRENMASITFRFITSHSSLIKIFDSNISIEE